MNTCVFLCIITISITQTSSRIFPPIKSVTKNSIDTVHPKAYSPPQLQHHKPIHDTSPVVWPLFEEVRYQYVGNWALASPTEKIPFDGTFNQPKGTCFLQFYKGKYDDIYISYKALNGDYSDGYLIETVLNVTNTPFDEKKATYNYTGNNSFTITHNMGMNSKIEWYDIHFEFKLLGKDLQPWNIKSTELYNLITEFELTGNFTAGDDKYVEDYMWDYDRHQYKKIRKSMPKKWIAFSGTAGIEGLEQLPAAYYVFACVIGLIMNAIGLGYILKGDNYLFMFNISPLSMGILIVFEMQSFIYNMNLNLLIERSSI